VIDTAITGAGGHHPQGIVVGIGDGIGRDQERFLALPPLRLPVVAQ
jgi:hypothetical protein